MFKKKGGVQEEQIYWEDRLKSGAWTVCRFKKGLGKKRGGYVFKGGWHPNAHYDPLNSFKHKETWNFLYLLEKRTKTKHKKINKTEWHYLIGQLLEYMWICWEI